MIIHSLWSSTIHAELLLHVYNDLSCPKAKITRKTEQADMLVKYALISPLYKQSHPGLQCQGHNLVNADVTWVLDPWNILRKYIQNMDTVRCIDQTSTFSELCQIPTVEHTGITTILKVSNFSLFPIDFFLNSVQQIQCPEPVGYQNFWPGYHTS